MAHLTVLLIEGMSRHTDFPPKYWRLFDEPSNNILDMWRSLGRSLTNGGIVVGTSSRSLVCD
jgi:hypothetical protein